MYYSVGSTNMSSRRVEVMLGIVAFSLSFSPLHAAGVPCAITQALTGSYLTSGQTTGGPNGPFTLTATNSTFSTVDLVPNQTFTFAELTSLFANFTSNSGGSGGGTPRIAVGVNVGGTEKFVLIYLGNSPNFTDTDAVLNTYSGVNLIGNNDPGRYDTSGLGGSPATTYSGSATSALTLAGNDQVLDIVYITDTFGAFPSRNETLVAIGGAIALPCAPGAYQVRYAANLSLTTDSTVDIVNTGGNGGVPPNGPGFPANDGGNICVNVYAVDPTEDLVSCCSCLVTPGQVVQLQVTAGIMTNTLTGKPPTSATIKLLGSAGPAPAAGAAGPGTCVGSAATVSLTSGTNPPVAGFVAFGTTEHISTPGSLVMTETPFIAATLSASELISLQGRCASILGNGSGSGVCSGCRQGALGANKQ
jgi:hypothetical protein